MVPKVFLHDLNVKDPCLNDLLCKVQIQLKPINMYNDSDRKIEDGIYGGGHRTLL